MRSSTLWFAIWISLVALLVQPGDVQAEVSGKPALSRAAQLASLGYTEQELFIKGLASQYSKTGDWEDDGHWLASPSVVRTPFSTRLLIRRPSDPAKFNGMVVVEWLNMTLGSDIDAGWSLTQHELIREGYAWVGVTLHGKGIDGLKKSDAKRYANTHVDGDDFSFDLFSQAGQAVQRYVKQELGRPKGGRLLALGYSQSAVFLFTYINAMHPSAKVYDGYLLLGAAPYAAPVVTGTLGKIIPVIRADLDVPVMQVQTEMEVTVSWPLSKTADTNKVRYWEVAGAAHFDEQLNTDIRSINAPEFGSAAASCQRPLNSLPLHEVDNAALHALRTWVNDGTPPPKISRMQRNALGFIKHDDYGHSLGGVRLPEIEAPLVHYGIYANFTTGSLASREVFSCVAGGSTTALEPAQLRALYPTHQDYVRRYQVAADAAQAAGYLRPADHANSLIRAKATKLP